MSLCVDGQHRWDAQVALRKGGVEPGDPCDCGAVQFGTAAERYAAAADAWAGRAFYLREALEPFASGGEWGKWKAWLVEGAPTREEGIAAARMLTRLQVKADAVLAHAPASPKAQPKVDP